MQRDMSKVVINLDTSRKANAYEDHECLWLDEIGRMFKLIESHYRSLVNEPPNKKHQLGNRHSRGKYLDEQQVHMPRLRASREMNPTLAIALFGTYGSGKSSLLRSFAQRVNRSADGYEVDETADRLSGHLYSLPVIEPNILHKTDQFLYEFLATALQEDLNGQGQDRQGSRDGQVLSPVQQKFQEVSEYLQAIDHSDSMQTEHDPLGISLERLDRHSAGIRLKRAMDEFIDVLADSLTSRNGLIVLPVDDADMSFEGLISTLDTLRRYLTHPRLVPVFTFTGRLAEELLRTNFEKKLNWDAKDSEREISKMLEATTELTITENLALQYLGKLFPVRNRIKLGYASARLQMAYYQTTNAKRSNKLGHTDPGLKQSKKRSPQEDVEKDGFSVLNLLEVGTRILFGFPDWPVADNICSPLRSSTLRRQIQIVDAMQASKVYEFAEPYKDEEGEGRYPTYSWAQVFDKSTWSLLNVHRDVLRELGLDLDDLYSWTPKGLRVVVLMVVLSMSLEKRAQLIKQWRYRTEDRRSQLLSLLAANVFRPNMYLEEPAGDEPFLIKIAVGGSANLQPQYGGVDDRINRKTFSLRKGSIWFLNLWSGFYLPQILFRNRKGVASQLEQSDAKSLKANAVGWSLNSAHIHAIREALNNREDLSTGMLFLDTKDFSEKVSMLTAHVNAIPEAIKCNPSDTDGQQPEGDQRKEIYNQAFVVFIKDKLSLSEDQIQELNLDHQEGLEKFDGDVPDEKIEATRSPLQNEIQSLRTLWNKYTDADENLRKVNDSDKPLIKNSWTTLLIDLWCFYGYDRGRIWAAVSFWRGLSLMGRLLEQDVKFKAEGRQKELDDKYKDFCKQVKAGKIAKTQEALDASDYGKAKKVKKQEIRSLLYRHIKTSKVLGNPNEEKDTAIASDMPSEDLRFGGWRIIQVEEFFDYLTEEIFLWLDKFHPQKHRINPIFPLNNNLVSDQSDSKEESTDRDSLEREEWKACFVRRMHGQNLISRFWHDLDYPAKKELTREWTALDAIKKWCGVVRKYWECGTHKNDERIEMNINLTQSLLLSCPFVLPFTCHKPDIKYPRRRAYQHLDRILETLCQLPQQGNAEQRIPQILEGGDDEGEWQEVVANLQQGEQEEHKILYENLPGIKDADVYHIKDIKRGLGVSISDALALYHYHQAKRWEVAADLLDIKRRFKQDPPAPNENLNVGGADS